MKCPKCEHDNTKVLESRLSHEGRAVRRRRSCLQCNYRYTTYEKEEDFVVQVRKKDGRYEPYSRDKALKALNAACSKRAISVDEIERILSLVGRHLHEEGHRQVDSQVIGDMIMEKLRNIDHVAYVRFASVYKEFKDSEEFIAELERLIKKTPDSADVHRTY